jgi:Leucine-rich repeat (LRR) protein
MPLQLVEFPKLEELNLGRNMFTELPRALGEVRTLKKLWFEDNQITSLPSVSPSRSSKALGR